MHSDRFRNKYDNMRQNDQHDETSGITTLCDLHDGTYGITTLRDQHDGTYGKVLR